MNTFSPSSPPLLYRIFFHPKNLSSFFTHTHTMKPTLTLLIFSVLHTTVLSNLLSQPAHPSPDSSSYNTVPSFPTQTTTQTCHRDLSNELFGGVLAACSHTLDRSRCCPVPAALLFAAHARSVYKLIIVDLYLNLFCRFETGSRTRFFFYINSLTSAFNSQVDNCNLHVIKLSQGFSLLFVCLFLAGGRFRYNNNNNVTTTTDIEPMMPDDSQQCVGTLQESLVEREIRIPQPNGSCDAVLCFCGIRLHQITSLSCPAAFNVSGNSTIAAPSLAVRNLERNCRNSSYVGCTECLGALQKVNSEGKNGTKHVVGEDRESKMMVRDCQLMGLAWLLARNKTAHIPTVSAVLRAIMYSAHPPHESTCSPNQENMPLAVNSLQFETNDSASSTVVFATICLQLLSLIILWHIYL